MIKTFADLAVAGMSVIVKKGELKIFYQIYIHKSM